VVENEPVYKHDCDGCVFLGHSEHRDIYYCDSALGKRIIERKSSEPADYDVLKESIWLELFKYFGYPTKEDSLRARGLI